MFRNSVTSKLRRRTSSCILASSIAVATIAVAGFTESPVRAAPVSFGQIIATRTVASDGSFNVYSGEEIEMSAGGNVSSTCLGQVLQPGDVVTMTDVDLQFSTMTFNYGAHMGISWTLPDPVPETFRIDGFTVKTRSLPAGTKVFSPKVKVTRSGQLLVETSDCVISRQGTARIDATSADAQNDLKDVSQYVARVGDARLRYSGRACVDMALVEPGDVLTYSYELKTGGQEVLDPNQNPSYTLNGSPVGATFTIANPEPTGLKLNISGAAAPEPTAGETYTFSLDIKKGNNSVATNNCPVNNPGVVPLPGGGGGLLTMPRLYPTGQVSLTGELTLGSTVSVSLPTWSRTDGGPALASTDIRATQFTWLLCSVGPVPQRIGAFGPPSACLMSMPPVLLANGTSFGTTTGSDQAFSGSSLTITEPLVTALTGKHLMVSVFIESAPAPGQMMGIFFNFNFKSCAPGENCADSFGPTSTTTTTVPATTTTTVQATTTTTPAVTTTVPATTTTVPATTTTVPPPALATVQALPVAPTPIVADATISTGEEITVSFGGFTPFEFVQLIVASTPQVIGSGYANAQGVVTLSGNLPSTLASGNHTLAVFAPVSGIGFTQPITVSQPLLPATGSDGQNNLFVIAMLLFVLGIVVRRTSTVITNK